MRKLLITLVGVLALGLGAANAQTIDDTDDTNYYAGGSLGFVTANGPVRGTLTGHFGLEDVLTDGLDARFDLGVIFGTGLNIGANALYNIEIEEESEFGIYVGGGPRLYFGDEALFGLGIRAGGNYEFNDVTVAFAELRLDPVFGSTTTTLIGIGVGANYYF